MLLDDSQIKRYQDDGFLVIDSLFDLTEVDVLRAAFARDAQIDGPQRIMEDDGVGVRAVYASHLRQPEFADLVRSPRVLGVARQLLSDELYLYQFKINAKPALGGERWVWHQDFPAWRLMDDLPLPRLVNVAVFLDEVTEFNGPVVFVPGSQLGGSITNIRRGTAKSEQHLDPDDIALGPDTLAGMVRRSGMVSPKGPAGSVVFFSPEIVHGSAPNMSPFSRRLLIMTFNEAANLPRHRGTPRAEYLVGRDTTPLEVVGGPLTGALA
jgi:ectoine hydroxylase